MSAWEKVKAAVAELEPEDQFDLFRWWFESPVFQQQRLAALKGALAEGFGDLANGRYEPYDQTSINQLATEVQCSGRARLSQRRV